MSQLNDFGVNNSDEDRLQGDEDYLTEVWDENDGVINPSEFDDPETEAESIEKEETVNELAKGNKEIVEPDEAELSS